MMTRVWYRLLALLLCVTCALPGCHDFNDDDRPGVEAIRLAQVQADLDALIDEGLEAELPPPLSQDELIEREVRLHRRQVVDDMVQAAAAAMTPLALAASMFAPEGAVDLALAVLPVHKLGRAVDVAREAFRIRRASKRDKRLVKFFEDFQSHLSKDADEFIRLTNRMSRAERRALRRIFNDTNSSPVVLMLARQHSDGHADVRWIAGMLGKKDVDKDFVRRFTFDADLVEDYTTHEAHPSWRVLQHVVEGTPVDDKAREVLAGKVAGLMGERVAMQRVKMSSVTDKYFQNLETGLAGGHGLRYRRGIPYGRASSIDIVAADNHGNALFVEVKHYSADTWAKSTQKVLDQLDRHNGGITSTTLEGRELRWVAGKVLMVSSDGFEAWKRSVGKKHEDFMNELKDRGWKLELFPSADIPTFQDVIDGLR